MKIAQQSRPDPITDSDWDFYLSTTAKECLYNAAKGLEENNRYIVDERFQKLIFSYMFEPGSIYFAQKPLYPPLSIYRARIYKKGDAEERMDHPEKYGSFQGYDAENSGAVPASKTVSGRANPEGVSYLYAASDVQTALLEARTQPGEFVSVATINLKKMAQFFDLTKNWSAISAESREKTKWINDFALAMSAMFQAPLSTVGSYYLCQYISEFAKNWHFDGIMYRASHVQELGTNNGICYTFFTDSKYEIVGSKLYYIEQMKVVTLPKV